MNFCAVLGTHPSDTPGGAELQAQLICEEFARRGHASFYIAHSSAREGTGESAGVTVHRLNPSGRYDRINDLLVTVREIDPDVIYLRNLKDSLFSGLFKISTDAHIVFNVSSDSHCLPRFAGWPGKTNETRFHALYRRTKLGFRRSALEISDTVFVQTKKQQELLNQHRNLDSVLTGNGHPVPDSDPEKDSPPVVLWLASIKELKNPRVFVDTAAECRDLDCEFWLVGRPSNSDLTEEIRNRAEKIPNLSYLGGCTVQESNEYIERASVFVNTSEMEGFPNTFIQSWFRKTPVISLHTDPIDSSAEYTTGYYGLENRSRLAARIRKLINEGEHRREIAEQAYAHACENNDIRAVVDRIEDGLPDRIIDSTTGNDDPTDPAHCQTRIR